MFKSKQLLFALFGTKFQLNGDPRETRSSTFTIPGIDGTEETIEIHYRTEDGLLVALVKRINSLEKELSKLKSQ